jgi:hypothetical protein
VRAGRERFLRPAHPYHRRYEALRAYFVDGLPAADAARRFHYTRHSFEVLVERFRRNDLPPFWRDVPHGRQDRPVRTPLREAVLDLRRQSLSVYDIAERLRAEGRPASHQTVWMILRDAGAKRLPKRTAAQKVQAPTVPPPVADARSLDLTPREIECRAPLLLYFAFFLSKVQFDAAVRRAGYLSSAMVSAPSALRAALALKLLQKPRKNHVMPLADDEGLGLFAGLNVLPKTTFLSDYSWRVDGRPHARLLEEVVRSRVRVAAYPSRSFNLDFHTIRHYGDPEATRLEKNYVPRRSQSVPSVAVAYAQEEGSEELVYAKADVLKREKADQVLRFVEYWKKVTGELPEELVFDSQMTTHPGLAELQRQGIVFLTLRERQPKEVNRVMALPESAWQTVSLSGENRVYRHPKVHEEEIEVTGYPGKLRQIVARDLGRATPMFLLTNDRGRGPATLLSRYPLRTHVENSIREQVEAFHVDALSSSVRLKVEMDVVLDVIASAAYRWFGRELRGWERATARRLWSTFLDRPGKVRITNEEVIVRVRRFSRAPVLLDSLVVQENPPVPWLGGRRLRLEITGDLKLTGLRGHGTPE